VKFTETNPRVKIKGGLKKSLPKSSGQAVR
jgi:hypothetical protein